MISSCQACGQSREALRTIGPVPQTQGGRFSSSEYRLDFCPVCEAVRLLPTPTPDDLRLMYEECIQFVDDPTYNEPQRVAEHLAYYGGCLDIYQITPTADEASLEVGAGLAWVSRAVKQREPAVITVAQDVTRECVDVCPWVDDYRIGDLARLDPERRYRLISLTHVIEHLVDPAAILRQLASLLQINGRLFITAPYRPTGWEPGQSVDAWLNYPYLHVPGHISYLSRTWFELIGAQCGLKVLLWDARHDQGQAFEVVLGRSSDHASKALPVRGSLRARLRTLWQRLRGNTREREWQRFRSSVLALDFAP